MSCIPVTSYIARVFTIFKFSLYVSFIVDSVIEDGRTKLIHKKTTLNNKLQTIKSEIEYGEKSIHIQRMVTRLRFIYHHYMQFMLSFRLLQIKISISHIELEFILYAYTSQVSPSRVKTCIVISTLLVSQTNSLVRKKKSQSEKKVGDNFFCNIHKYTFSDIFIYRLLDTMCIMKIHH